MTSLLNRLFGRSRRGSGATAKDRLRFVLQHDRINLPPERAEEMKKEILAVIVKYLAVDQERVEIALEQRDRLHSKLVAEIPIVSDSHKTPAPASAAPAPAKAEPNGQAKLMASDSRDSGKASDDGETATDDESAKEPVASAAKSDEKSPDKKS